MKRLICKFMVLCLCLTMFVSCGKEANNDPSAQLSKQTTATENKEPSMSILDINKLPEDITPEYVNSVSITQRSFYRKQLNVSEGVLGQDEIFFEVIESKEELDAFLKKGFFDDTLKTEGVSDSFEEIYNTTTSDIKFFERSVLIIVGEYSDYNTHVISSFMKNHDGSYLIRYRHNSHERPEEKIDGGFFGSSLIASKSLFKIGTPIKDQIEIDDWSIN